ncbi:MAG TPA: MltA domain-containing protein [Brevundimonas sp.]|uniref:MltA domain-containing protein n=1 Tax=Brevundimonas sp. TaxID=1871086 RepID=UPI002DF2585B|nr:MltA domain-containing protein [Brevundimonas sp.]
MIRRLLPLLGLLAAACATAPAPGGPPAPPVATPRPPSGPVVVPAPAVPPLPAGAVSLTALPGWEREDHAAALQAYAAGCRPAADPMCERARAAAAQNPSAPRARDWLEVNFAAVEARTPDGAPGRLTAYFAPEYPARRFPDAEFSAPVLPAPPGWRRGDVGPTRAEIEARPAPQALAFMRAEDLFFMQVQGSGYLTFEDGSRARAAYAADNGQRFTGIATPMAERGLLPRNGTSGEAIRSWLAAHRGPRAAEVMALNPRYIYFRMDPDDGGHPAGAAGVPLSARRSIAVDPSYWTYGAPVWIEADAGNLAGARSGYSGLVMALDTGSAIRGPVRADFYMGRGDAAGDEAGTVRHPLRMWRIVPR